MSRVRLSRKKLVLIVILVICAVLFCAARIFTARRSAVLMYHAIEEEPFSELEHLFTTPEDFEEQVKKLKDEGYTFYFADQFRQMPKTKCIILTFDDGYEDNFTKALPIVEKYGAKMTVFVVPDFVGTPNYLTLEQLKELAASDCVEIGSHTKHHFNLTELSREEMKSELERSKSVLGEMIGKPIFTVSYPFGAADGSVMETAREYYDAAYTTNDACYSFRTDPFYIPRVTVNRGMSGDDILKKIGHVSFWDRVKRKLGF